ncbi:MAG: Hsp20/alpha crystallin family protein [bacterium]|nr:Hsp20/alpha crystallin family protein [bacterium]MDZ4247904.1 Hsp20/alpha crystallin family protein [Patescibacteria group bacterium]
MAQTHDQSASPFFGTTHPEAAQPESAPSEPEAQAQGPSVRSPEPFAHHSEEPDEDDQAGGEIAVDVHETDDSIVIVSPIAGVDPENVEIAADDDSVTISGERRSEHHSRSQNTVKQEIYWGRFSRTIELPAAAEVEKAKATFKHGVLTVTIPKTGKQKKRTIKVKTVE